MSTWSPLSSGVSLAADVPVVPPCPYCQHDESIVVKSLLSAMWPGCRRRRRECTNCQQRFTTIAREALAPNIARRGQC